VIAAQQCYLYRMMISASFPNPKLKDQALILGCATWGGWPTSEVSSLPHTLIVSNNIQKWIFVAATQDVD
jgi:hypothetical protein